MRHGKMSEGVKNASRSGVIRVVVIDKVDNSTTKETTVTVPHDMRKMER